jgi:superfamily II DNA or RNA helicase
MEADHVVPFSKGGSTVVENGKLIPKEMNRVKGNKSYELRDWQKRFEAKWEARKLGEPFLLVAVPGGGKTVAALHVARQWLGRGNDRRIVIVVPSKNLQEQWRGEAHEVFSLDMQTKELGARFNRGFVGAVVTYQFVVGNAMTFRGLCGNSPTMVVMDEHHHCGDDESWGQAIQDAFGLAKEKLMLSGTPWKTSGNSIPFVKYDAMDFCVPDFVYDRRQALEDGVVRWLTFECHKGRITNETTGEEFAFHQDISVFEAESKLGKLLRADEQFCESMIRKSHARLTEVRKSIPDAAGMVACIDKSHAQRMARIVARVTGCSPSVIVSDSDVSNDSVREFRNSSTEWLVCVRQVSEGTDIKRIQVLCYLTNWATELFFQQLVGRPSRVRGIDDFEAYVFMPADPRLIEFANSIEDTQMKQLRLMESVGSDTGWDELEREPQLDIYSTLHEGVGLVLIANRQYTAEQAALIGKAASAGGVTLDQAARVLESVNFAQTNIQNDTEPITQGPPAEVRMDRLRSENNRLAFYLSKKLDVEVREIHRRFKRHQDMDEAELKKKLATLKREIANA